MTDTPPEAFKLPLPVGYVNTNFSAYVPYLLMAVDDYLMLPDLWKDDEYENAVGLLEDLKQYIMTAIVIPLGTVIASAALSAPAGFMPCDGRSLSKSDYPDLYSALGDTYGSDSLTFRLPDLRGRTIVGVGQGLGLTNRLLGDQFGSEQHQLTVGEMPAHSHRQRVHSGISGAGYGTAYLDGRTGSTNATQYTEAVGNNQPHNNVQPSLALNYYIYVGA